MKMEQSVPKRRHLKFRRRGITQKTSYNSAFVVGLRKTTENFGRIGRSQDPAYEHACKHELFIQLKIVV